MNGSRRNALGLSLASVLLAGAWIASGDPCGANTNTGQCRPLWQFATSVPAALSTTVAAKAPPLFGPPPAQDASVPVEDANRSQSVSLVLFGSALALAAHVFKGQKHPGPAEQGR
jgi:hypothetical protein